MGDGLVVGGVNGAMRLYDWGMPFPGGFLANLTRVDRNRKRAAELACQIMAYQDCYPGRPVHLLAQSGGAGIAVWAAEALPADHMIDGIVILGGALSPQYDLRKALARCRKGILNSHSHKDWLILGWGTRIFGTTDRQFCDACGRVGFQVPQNISTEDRKLYRKLHQIPWTPDMGDTCSHWGGHLTRAACEEYLVTQHRANMRCGRKDRSYSPRISRSVLRHMSAIMIKFSINIPGFSRFVIVIAYF